MGSTSLKRQGYESERLTDKQRSFAEHYAIHSNATQAAIEAGYSRKTAQSKGSQLLRMKKVNAYVRKLQRGDVKEMKIDRQEALRQLLFALTRRVGDFVNPNTGMALLPHELPEHCQSIVDGFKQKITENYETGDRTIVMEYKLSPHAIAREQAMKHQGLFDPGSGEKGDEKIVIDFDVLFGKPDDIDPIEAAIQEADQE